ncbi:unnamed protein product [Adineta steineri]|uniref:Uncharacterized protein n=1 Tax=Adineta steineri TaxID=433720 RepID=A0A818IJF4_9BILA|nr:unnamed protein product [Adineta steineri]
MILNRDIKILIGFILSLMIFVSLRDNPIQDFQDYIIPQHYNLEFIDYSDNMICNVRILFQFTQDRYYFLIIKSSLINLCRASNLIPIENNRIIIKRRQWKKYFYKAYQWVDTLIQFNNKNQWIGKSLARSIAKHLFNKTNNPIEKFMSTVIIDSLCNTESDEKTNNIILEDILIQKGEAFLTAYRLSIGDNEFQSQIQQLIFNESILFTNPSLIGSQFLNHHIISLNSSINDIHLFKLNSNFSLPSFPLTLYNSSFISNPFFPYLLFLMGSFY